MPRKTTLFVISLMLCSSLPVIAATEAIPDTPFVQEFHQPYPIPGGEESNDVRAVAVDASGNTWAATRNGVYMLANDASDWSAVLQEMAFDVLADGNGVFIAAWNGAYHWTAAEGIKKIPEIDDPIAALCASEKGVIALSPGALWELSERKPSKKPLDSARGIRDAAADDDGLWVATSSGLFHRTAKVQTSYFGEKEILSSDVRGVAFDSEGRLWAASLGGITLYKDGKRVGEYTTRNGLPSVYLQCIKRAPSGAMWIGMDRGLVRFDGKTWSLRHSRRWLINDDVRDIAFDSDGTAWIATAAGVSAIRQKTMTLEQKARDFQQINAARHVREPYLVEKCRLKMPGDLSTWEPEDDDNDGQYTAMYVAMEAFRYAATKAPEARENAKKAFDALVFLQTVTETNGFIARTVVPASWKQMHDPGETATAPEAAQRRLQEPRFKSVEKRWLPSKDGKWLWKRDTSSDEITGHFYAFSHYYDLVADENERKSVRKHVTRVMDYIIDGGFTLIDIDGTHTRWAVWAPEKLNDDPDWAAERGINSVEILSFLKTAYHITGNERYQHEYLHLLHKHHYAENARNAKNFAIACRTHIDDELLALAYPALLKYETDPELLKIYRESVERWYSGIKDDQSPYFNFLYASLTGSDPRLAESVAFLRDCPVDVIRWTIDNSWREDLRLVRAPEIEPLQTDRMLPADERGTARWDNNPWAAVQGDGAHSESTATFWLLPYWMARYQGLIQAVEKR